MIDYKSLAKTAALRFLNEDIPLNCSITKLAEENNLNTEQISRVCELSNKSIHAHCLLKVADKNFTFELADSSKVAANIDNKDSGITSSFEPRLLKQSAYTAEDIFGPAEKSTLKAEQDKAIFSEKLGAAIKEIDSKILYESTKLAEHVQDLKTQIDQMKMYGIKTEDIRQALVAADPLRADEVNKLIDKVTDTVSGTLAAPAEDAKTYVNPDHPVVLKVKNIFAKNDTIQSLGNSREYLKINKCKLDEVQK